jgi:hypothetical protein
LAKILLGVLVYSLRIFDRILFQSADQ